MRGFEKDRAKGRVKWFVIAGLLLAWAFVHLQLLQMYIENEDSVSAVLKAFILDHIIWWYLAPFVYGLLGLVALFYGFFKPKREADGEVGFFLLEFLIELFD